MAEHFSNLLESIAATPSANVSSLQLMSAHEHELTLRTFNATDTPLSTATVHGLFEATAAAQPHDVCLLSPTSQLSYAQVRCILISSSCSVDSSPQSVNCHNHDCLLPHTAASNPQCPPGEWYMQVNERANQLAHHLVELGVTAGRPVVVMMDKVCARRRCAALEARLCLCHLTFT